jgi:hypothetical protein
MLSGGSLSPGKVDACQREDNGAVDSVHVPSIQLALHSLTLEEHELAAPGKPQCESAHCDSAPVRPSVFYVVVVSPAGIPVASLGKRFVNKQDSAPREGAPCYG